MSERLREVVGLPLRPQEETECRRCEVHCDKVIYPGACVQRSCPFLYAYEAFDHTYVGCMQKIYQVEIDLELLCIAEEGKGFGAVKAKRDPLPMCLAEVDQCYAHRRDRLGCRNPEFNELPVGQPTFRVLARVRRSS